LLRDQLKKMIISSWMSFVAIAYLLTLMAIAARRATSDDTGESSPLLHNGMLRMNGRECEVVWVWLDGWMDE